MTNEEIISNLKKLTYHMEIVKETIDYEKFPVQSLILSMDWEEDTINKVHDIFEKYDTKLYENEEVNWHQFESELRDELNIGYQSVKSIILAFYRNGQWVEVCIEYAKGHECVEFHSIFRDINYKKF